MAAKKTVKKTTKRSSKKKARVMAASAGARADAGGAAALGAGGVPCPGAGTTSQVPVRALCQTSVANCLDEVLRVQGNGWVLCGYQLDANANTVTLLFK